MKKKTAPVAHPPRLNGARVFGCRPGAPIQFRLAASGTGPLYFDVERLPRGLRLDARTGQLSGSLREPGRHTLAIRISGPGGHCDSAVVVHCGARIALTPPMGWNSWNCWAASVSQEKVLTSATAMANLLLPHGWNSVNIDDAWQGERSRRAPYALQPNEKFPDMAGLADAIHGMGLRMGIYSTPWATSYAGFRGGSDDHPRGQSRLPACPDCWWERRAAFYHGLHSFAAADARQWAAWGVDYLKYDWYPNDVASTRAMDEALRASGRDIVLSLSNTLSFEGVFHTLPHAQVWRTTGDIVDEWSRGSASHQGFQGIADIIRHHAPYHVYQKPGHWNDPDMLVLGQVGWGPNLHPTRLTQVEQLTHFATWCLWSAPLLIGCPLDRLDPFTLALLTNDELIDLNQDACGVQAYPIQQSKDTLILRKPLAGGSVAFGLLNFGESPREMTLDRKLAELLTGDYQLRDLVARQDLGALGPRIGVDVEPHGIRVVRCTPTAA